MRPAATNVSAEAAGSAADTEAFLAAGALMVCPGPFNGTQRSTGFDTKAMALDGEAPMALA